MKQVLARLSQKIRTLRVLAIVIALFLVALFTSPSHGAGERFNQAVADYTFQLDQYRKSYDDFILKREQFKHIDSFANQEAMVNSAKVMLTLRAKTWLAYWQAMRVDVTDTEGIDSKIQADLTTEFATITNDLQSHEATVSALTDRDSLLTEADWLNDQDDAYSTLVYKTLLELRIARFHWALLQLENFIPTLRNNIEIQIRDAAMKDRKLRGLQEIEQLVMSSREQFEQVITDYYELERIRDYENIYEETTKKLVPAYSPLRRAQQLISEVAQGTVY